MSGRKQKMTMTHPIRVLIADDSVRARAGLRALLATWPEIEVVGEATNGQEAVRLVAECRPSMVLMDLRMPLMDGLQATQQIKTCSPDVIVIVVTIDAAARTMALAAGADGFVVKGDAPEGLRDALQSVNSVGPRSNVSGTSSW